jgi:yjeF C-terminal region, hydroxyethylthiazole kinase-related
MRALVSCAEARRLDAATQSVASLQPLLLMEDAAIGIWRKLEPLAEACGGAGREKTLLALCGPGNNGGDALAALRLARFAGLTKLAAVCVRAPGELAAIHAASLRKLGIPLVDWNDEPDACRALVDGASLILDGLSGTGLSGALRESSASLIDLANAATLRSGFRIASIDLPSGLSDSYAAGWPLIHATWTLSIEPRKACLYYPAIREASGEIIPVEGVFPADSSIAASASLLEEEDLRRLAPLPPRSAYKGTRGRVAVFAGSIGASGAAALSSRACLAAGAGIVSLFASPELYPIVAPMLEAVMVKPEAGRPADLASNYDALLVGPGWGRGESRAAMLAEILESGIPAVLDADAIALYRGLRDSGLKRRGPLVLTPHPGEFFALTGIESGRSLANPPACLLEAAASLDATIVLKSQVSWIASPSGELAVWDGNEAGLGTAGSGDVLAGLCAGLLARAPAFDAARAAVIAHGLAGRAARAERGWFEAPALIEVSARILGRG